MSRLLDLFRLIPGAGKVMSLCLIIGGALFFVYYQWGLMPALVLLAGIVVIGGLILIYNLIIKASERQNGVAFGKAMSNAQVGASRGEVRSAVDALAEKWKEANHNLRQANLDLYTLPWYTLIGEPQSGKSTTLKFSGLKFPIGMESISGGGGTRNCDWWFTEQGIILDTAGRFTFQESTATDAAEWSHFLNLLAKHRPYCPINGVILVVPVTSLLGDDPGTRQAKARNISEKLHSIQKALGIQFPVYVLLTKGDMIYGFTEFFNKLSVDQQREMFGWSSPILETGFNLGTFDESFHSLCNELDQVRLRNLSRPHYSDDANKTYIFPEEFRALHKPLREYMSIIFESSVYRAPLFFRGYYLTSGMQEGKPIANACRALLQKGVTIPSLEHIFTKSRAFFIRDFYTEKVFPEEGLVQRAYEHLKKDKIKKRVIWGLNVGLLLVGALFVYLMYSSLSARLDEPKAAIDQSLSVMKDVQGNFFVSDRDRETIYRTLKDLQGAIGSGQQGSYLVFLKGKQNELTERLQDTFAYLYLDKVLVGLYDAVVDQVGAFEIAAPATPRNSAAELEALVGALRELNEWRYQVERDTADDFKPSLTPFLNLAIDPNWNQDLAKFRGDQLLGKELESWFQQVYARSSKRVRAFVIQALVDRSENVFEDLELAVKRFYENQPEMRSYVEKMKILQELERAYAEVKEPALTREDYHERLLAIAPYFSEENQLLLGPTGDRYLPMPEVVKRIMEGLGPAFSTLGTEDDSPNRAAQERREMQADVVAFINRLQTIQPGDYPDPRAERGDEAVEGLTYSAEVRSFWEHIVKPYIQELLPSEARYADLPEEADSFSTNLEGLFALASERANLMKEILQANAFEHTALVTNERERARFEEALDTFYRGWRDWEQELFLKRLRLVIASRDIGVPPPRNRDWRGFVAEFNRLTDHGRDEDHFLEGVNELEETLRTNFRREIVAIFSESYDLMGKMKDYRSEVERNLDRFARALADLDAIPSSELASNRSRYQGRYPQRASLENLSAVDVDRFDLFEAHRRSLDAWSSTALSAFAGRVGGADPCPQCRTDFNAIKVALEPLTRCFPVSFNRILSAQSDEPGVALVSARLCDGEQLDKLVSALETFRNATGPKADYLKRQGLNQFMEDAFAWVDSVRRIQSGQVTVRYKLQTSAEENSISRLFAFCDLRGYFRARKLSLNSPTYCLIEVDESGALEGVSAEFRLFNDTEGNRAESRLRVLGKEMELFAFILDGAALAEGQDTYDRIIQFAPNFGGKNYEGIFRFKFSQPVAPPPDWSAVLSQ